MLDFGVSMSQLLQFMLHHWILFSALFIIIVLLAAEETRGRLNSLNISPLEATQLINRDQAVIVDIRDSNTYSAGHIINAINIPHPELDNNMAKLEKFNSKTVIVVCAMGQSASSAATKLKNKGFEKVRILAGGISAWRDAGLPLTKM